MISFGKHQIRPATSARRIFFAPSLRNGGVQLAVDSWQLTPIPKAFGIGVNRQKPFKILQKSQMAIIIVATLPPIIAGGD